jgi:hypothetical protein
MASSNTTAPTFPPGYEEETNGKMLIIPCALFIAICPIFVGIRIWARLSMIRQLHSEDWALLLALVRLFGPHILLI